MTTNETTGTKIDWPVVVLIGMVLAAAIAALGVLDITKQDLAAVTADQWLIAASVLGGVAGTLIAAFRQHVLGRAPAAPRTPEPRRPREGSVQLAVLWIVLAAGLALLLSLPGCGAGALRVPPKAASSTRFGTPSAAKSSRV